MAYVVQTHMGFYVKRQNIKTKHKDKSGAKKRTSYPPELSQGFPLCGKSGKLESTSERPEGVPPILLAPPCRQISLFRTTTKLKSAYSGVYQLYI